MRNDFWKSGLALSVAAVAIAPVAAQGADEAEARQQTVVVTGTPIRDSQAAAIEAKRNADNVVDIIAADTIGRFPDQSLAQALTRVPGLAVESDQGEARFVNFRGGRFRYTTISFDGVDVLGADDGRIPRFDSIPAIITSSVEANKAVTPDLPGAPVLGHININTYSPFDKDGLGFAGTIGTGQRTLNDGDLERYAVRLSYSTDQFGVLGFANLDKRDRFVDNREFEFADTDADGSLDSVVNLDYRQYGGFRENSSYGGKAEFRPDSGAVDRVFASSIYYRFADEEDRNQFDFDFDPVPLGSSGTLPVVLASRLLENGRYESETLTNTLGIDLAAADWDIEARLNFTETENLTNIPLIQSSATVPISATYDISNLDDPILNPTTFMGTDPFNVNQFSGNFDLGLFFYGILETESTKVLFDAERDLSFLGKATTIKTGLSYDMREASGGDALGLDFSVGVDPNAFQTAIPWDSDFTNSIGGVYYDNSGLREAWFAAEAAADPDFSPIPTLDPEDIVGIEEDILAIYGMATTDFDWGNVVYGLRFESTDFSTTGNQVVNGVSTDINVSNDYTNLLPSVHVNVDLRDDLKLRVSGTSGLSRPTYTEARASQSVDPTAPSVSGGNPNLDPEESIGLDVSLEWYFGDASILSAGAFYRSIDNVIYPGGTTIDGATVAPGLFAPGEQVEFNTFLNGEDGELSGIEFNFIGQGTFLPEPFDGLGASGNITFLDSEFFAPEIGANGITAPIPGTSDLIYNASIFYEKFGFSGRISYQWRDAWLSTTESGPSLNQFWDETERLDAKVQYEIPYTFGGASTVVFFEANNLSDANDRRYIDTPATIDQIEGYGQSYLFGISVDY